MRLYCEHGALTAQIRAMQHEGRITLLHFPYDPDSRSGRTQIATPSYAQIRDLNLPIDDLPGTFADYSASRHLERIRTILGPQHRRDALHIDSAVKSGCAAFLTRDSHILGRRVVLEAELGLKFFNPDTDAVEIERFVSGNSGAV